MINSQSLKKKSIQQPIKQEHHHGIEGQTLLQQYNQIDKSLQKSFKLCCSTPMANSIFNDKKFPETNKELTKENTKVLLKLLCGEEPTTHELIDAGFSEEDNEALDTIREKAQVMNQTSSLFSNNLTSTTAHLVASIYLRSVVDDAQDNEYGDPRQAVENILKKHKDFPTYVKGFLAKNGIKASISDSDLNKTNYNSLINQVTFSSSDKNEQRLVLNLENANIPQDDEKIILKNKDIRQINKHELAKLKAQAKEHLISIGKRIEASELLPANKEKLAKQLVFIMQVVTQYQRKLVEGQITPEIIKTLAQPIFEALNITDKEEKNDFVKAIVLSCTHEHSGLTVGVYVAGKAALIGTALFTAVAGPIVLGLAGLGVAMLPEEVEKIKAIKESIDHTAISVLAAEAVENALKSGGEKTVGGALQNLGQTGKNLNARTQETKDIMQSLINDIFVNNDLDEQSKKIVTESASKQLKISAMHARHLIQYLESKDLEPEDKANILAKAYDLISVKNKEVSEELIMFEE